ncbi:glutamate-gated chloride channel-like [Penaeus chinensis]|uniref:glutamate-gated chloride channel-like n=1 Tax=Penaeus chinensis TaxID=139456 RepID=UPI001FB7D82D|nr:glutamate-gated chloride channel-like [Penaeus chinensis]
MLLLTSCGHDQFTCSDGLCISKDKRCDLSLDCPDKSDEANCNRVSLPTGYSSKLPPPRIDDGPVPIYTFLTVRTIRKFDLANFRIAIDLQVQMKWLDTRLQFRNLQNDHRSNKLDNYTEVWAPSLKLIDGTYGTIVEHILSKGVFVMKESDPLPDDDAIIYEEYKYDGAKNLLLFQEEMTVEFACYFDLVMYPFDQQQCYLMFEIHDYDLGLGYLVKLYEFIDHNASHVGFLTSMTKRKARNSMFLFQLELMFSNQFRYYIGNIFMPSLMLVVLCYVTLLFDLSDFNVRSRPSNNMINAYTV